MDLSLNSVWLQRCHKYEEKILLDCFDRIIPPAISTKNLNSSFILLKPNLITARLGTLACTEGQFILAAAKWFFDKGARVTIGDSPAFGNTTSVLRKLGIIDQLRKLPVVIANFSKVTQVTLSSGIKAGIATHAMDCDMLINMPRVKAHAQLRVSLGVKNLFGCVVGMRKPLWHMTYGGCGGGFANHLVELMSVLPSGVTLVDGITAMNQTGPITGRSFPLGIVACSTNPVAVDRGLLEILGVKPELSPLMQSCLKKKIVGADFDQLDFPALCPEDFDIDNFVVPNELHPIRFNPFRFARGNIRRVLHNLGLSS